MPLPTGEQNPVEQYFFQDYKVEEPQGKLEQELMWKIRTIIYKSII